jgi:hypothetical protein
MNLPKMKMLINRITDLAAEIGFRIERTLVVSIEALRRSCMRLNLWLYYEQLRIHNVTEGSRHTGSNKFVIFVLYSTRIPQFTLNAIDAFNRASFNLIIVSNEKIDASTRSFLLGRSCLLIERLNFGRDFGGYRDGIRIALHRFKNITRLILANDSVFYLENGIDQLVMALDGADDFIGVSEIFEHHYHVASFLLSFGSRIINDSVFRRFWECYLPISTRIWAILEGEGELTKRLVAAGYRPHILFKAEQLRAELQCLSTSETKRTATLFPEKIRAVLEGYVDQPDASVKGFADVVANEVLARNQMHAAGFAFMKFLGLPLFKRDIVYRELFTVAHVNQIIADFGVPMQTEIMADLKRRTPPVRSNLLQRLLYRHGFI